MNDHGDERLRDLLGTLREDHQAPPELKRDVMRRIAAIPDPLWKRALDWLVRPRTVSVSPAAAGLALAGLVGVLTVWPAMGPEGTSRAEGPVAATADAEAERTVATRFVLVAPGASSVRMTGDFVSWDPDGIALDDARGTGLWTVDVPLEPGVYQYTFIVDGTEWLPDPMAVSQVDDGFGQTNSVVIVSGDSEA